LLATALLAAGAAKLAADEPPDQPPSFGVMLGGTGLSVQRRVELAKELGAACFRPNATVVGMWTGKCGECDAAKAAGLSVVLTVYNSKVPMQPSFPPDDMEAYKSKLAAILSAVKPALLVVENEENSLTFYRGTPDVYLEQLRAACEVAHAQGIACANGGLVSKLVALLMYRDKLDAGDEAAANEFLSRTWPDATPERLDSIIAAEQILKGRKLLEGYKAAGADYVNFHWYIPDPQALAETVAFLERVTGLRAMTNEIGQQKNEDPGQVTSLMQAIVDIGLPYAVWFSIDVPGFGEARGLVDENSNLRANGKAFHDFIQMRFP
jgi:hypothetical protein